MARGTRATSRTIPASQVAPPSPAKPAKAGAKTPAPKGTARKALAERAPVVSKDELRAKVEKLERNNAALRAKGREATKAAKTAAAHIAELEEEVVRLEKQIASQAASAKRSAKRSEARGRRSIDPGDGVPPGIAVAEPEALDEEAEKALENLDEHLVASQEGDQN